MKFVLQKHPNMRKSLGRIQMRDRKPRREKHRIVARVSPEFHQEVHQFAKKVGMNIQTFVVAALMRQMQDVDLQVKINQQQNQLKASKETQERLQKERNQRLKELKKVSSKLGVPETDRHCIQRIAEIEQALQTATDKVSIVEADRDEIQAQQEETKRERDTFKAKFEEKVAELQVCEDKVGLLLGRGLWDRILNALPWTEMQKPDEE